MNQFTHISRS